MPSSAVLTIPPSTIDKFHQDWTSFRHLSLNSFLHHLPGIRSTSLSFWPSLPLPTALGRRGLKGEVECFCRKFGTDVDDSLCYSQVFSGRDVMIRAEVMRSVTRTGGPAYEVRTTEVSVHGHGGAKEGRNLKEVHVKKVFALVLPETLQTIRQMCVTYTDGPSSSSPSPTSNRGKSDSQTQFSFAFLHKSTLLIPPYKYTTPFSPGTSSSSATLFLSGSELLLRRLCTRDPDLHQPFLYFEPPSAPSCTLDSSDSAEPEREGAFLLRYDMDEDVLVRSDEAAAVKVNEDGYWSVWVERGRVAVNVYSGEGRGRPRINPIPRDVTKANIQVESIYQTEKARLHALLKEETHNNEALYDLLSDFLRQLLFFKPEDVVEFARMFFGEVVGEEGGGGMRGKERGGMGGLVGGGNDMNS